MSVSFDPKRSPIETLGQFVDWLKRPNRVRHAYWRSVSGKRWALILVTYGKPGEPQDPAYEPARPTTDREIRVIRRHRTAGD
jgi:hypothetical protein